MTASIDEPTVAHPSGVGHREQAWLALLVALHAALGILYATRIPPYNAPDEPAHVNYVREIAEHAALPVLQVGDWDAALLDDLKAARFPPDRDVSAIRYESHQPPLYYLLLAPVARLTGDDQRAQVVALRVATVAISALTLVALHRAAWRVFRGEMTVRLAVVGFAAFVPMHIATGASVSNDALTELFLTLLLWRCLVALAEGLDTRQAAVLGGLAGLGMLTKVSAAVGLPLLTVAILGAARPSRVSAAGVLRQAGPHLVAAWSVALLLFGPWLLRGVFVYGPTDPIGLRRHDLVVAGQPLTGAIGPAVALRSLATLFRSFWGQFGWMGVLLDERIYLGLAGLTAIVLLSLGLFLAPWGGFWRDLTPLDRREMALASLPVLSIALGTLGYNLTYLQPQGRYLFPAMAGIALWSVAALRETIAPRQRAAVFVVVGLALVGLDVVALFRYVEPALRP